MKSYKYPKYQIEETEYEKVDVMTFRVLYMYKLFRLLFNPKLKKHLSEEHIQSIKQKVKEQIDESLDSLSFDDIK
ncbi:hypothetical protein H2O64_15055 [Kordia sp. YSTF-M3]|uniref:Uncharacterized protein n=1 Tax=Kordia aestuariivivens TaxID=2759037 RepID=A0ABR7QBQ7_9FLAO|nr:hypothetical protein [Kordia aestuariivivens]MBC8755995.1 hypothetical protein [Kordia aestuariivivens]